VRSCVDEVRLIDSPTIKRPREGYTFLIVEVKVINEGGYFYPWQWFWFLKTDRYHRHSRFYTCEGRLWAI
jgi:hypothetical protein